MKRFLLLSTMFILLFTSRGYGQFVEDFEGGIPATWATFKTLNGTLTDAVNVPGWTISTTNICEGTTSAYIDRTNIGAGNTSEGWLVTPAITVPANGRLYFTAKTSFPQDYGTEYVVRVSTTSQTEISSFTDLVVYNETQISPLGDNICFEHGNTPTINLDAYAGQDVYIAFVKKTPTQPAAAPYADRWVLDMVKILEQCMPPTNLGAVPGATDATLSWVGNASAGWEVEVLEGVNVPGTGFPTHTGNSVPFYVDGLADSTPHTYYVRANCGDSYSPWAGPFVFTTQQIPVTLPYSTDFESPSHGWQLGNGTQVNKWVVGTAVSNSPTHSLYVSNDGTSNNYSTTSTSIVHAYRDVQIPADATEIYFSFDWRGVGDSNDYFRLWHTPVTFTPTPGIGITYMGAGFGIHVQNVNHFNNPGWVNVGYIVDVSAYAGQVRRFIFEWRNNNSGGVQPPAAIDNINISVITCTAPPVAGLAASGVTSSEATFSWNAANPAPASYDYYMSTSSTTPDDATPITGNVATTSVTIDTLDPSTTYYFWVRSNCGGADGASFWVGPVVISTPPVVISLEDDYYTDFEEANPGWTLSNGTQVNKWVIGTAVSNSPTHSLYVSNNNGANNTYTLEAASVVHAYKDFAVPAGTSQIYLSYDWRNAGQTGADYIRVWTVPASYTPTPGTQITAGVGRQQFGGNHVGQPNWTNSGPLVVNADPYQGDVVRLIFEWRNDASGGAQPPGAVDNITFSVITCPAPTGLAVSGTPTVDTANLTWSGTGTLYEYYVSTSSSSPSPTTTPTGDTTNTNVGLTDLEDATTYYFWVRSNCGADGVSFWVGPVVFTTPQIPATMNFYDNFEGPIKWTFNNGTQPNKWVVGTATSNSPTHSLYISNDNGVSNTYTTTATSITHAYRDIQIPAGTTDVVLSFVWKAMGEGTAFDYMRVWLVPATFTPTPGTQIGAGAGRIQIGGNLLNQSEWTTFTQIFTVPAALAGNTGRLVFEWKNDGSAGAQPPAAVDGITFNVLTCPAPTNLTAETQDGSLLVDLSWTPGGSETQWEIIVQETGTGAPSPEATGIIVNEPNYTFSAENDVLYEFYVRAICDEDSSSLWSGPQLFSIFNPPGCANVEVFDPEMDIVLPGSEYIVCPDEDNCVPLSANYMLTGETTSYEIESIDYAPPFPFTGGTPVSVGTDDVWSPVVELPFEFCFFGEIYSEVIVGSNGVVSFDTTDAEGYCPYSFNQTIPNTGFPILNAIYGVYQDIDPNQDNDVANPDINYQVLGTYPCRALVVNFSEVAQFSSTCNNNPDVGAQTTQIVIYEISNVIEVYVGNRVPCTSWQNGAGVLGLQNADGTEAYVPTDRNTGAWTATEEAWRFTPNGDTNVVFEWLQDGVTYSDQKDITVCVTEPTTLTARATYTNCNGELLVKESDVTIRLAEEVVVDNLVDLGICTTGEIVTVDLNDAMVDFVAGLTNPENFTITFYETEEAAIAGGDDNLADEHETNTTETIYVRVQETGSECYYIGSFEIVISDNPPQFTLEGELDVCEGQSSTLTVEPINFDIADATITWTLDGADLPETGASINATEAGIYEVSVVVDCEATEAVTVTVHESPVADLLDNVTECDTYVLPALSDNNNYYTGPDGTGDMLAVGDEITTDQTIYIYAQVEGLECTDETSFIVDIVPTPALTIAAGCEDNLYILEVSLGEDYTEADVVIEWTDSTGAIVGTGTSVVAEEPGEYTVTVTPTGDVSCPAVLSETVDTVACMIPKGISPNGDTLNDNFDLTGFNVRKISIFNRYGKEVFTQGAYTNEWYGQDKKGNELPTGTYYYSIELENGDSKTGWVYINREE